jgi:antitoxin component YwqK of YwqJK toxin-antitoxin module
MFAALSAPVHAAVPRIDIPNTHVSKDGLLWLLDGKIFTGELRRVDGDGSVIILSVSEGLLHGLTQSNYADGKLRAEFRYHKDQPVGLHRSWWPTGQLQAERNFADGMPEGVMRTWYASGQQYQEHRYHRGREAGLQQVWNIDGRLRASYEIRNGRRFGNMGAMGCVGGDRPVAKSVLAPVTEVLP